MDFAENTPNARFSDFNNLLKTVGGYVINARQQKIDAQARPTITEPITISVPSRGDSPLNSNMLVMGGVGLLLVGVISFVAFR